MIKTAPLRNKPAQQQVKIENSIRSIFKCLCLMQCLGAGVLGGEKAADMMGSGGQGAICFSVLSLMARDKAWKAAQEFFIS